MTTTRNRFLYDLGKAHDTEHRIAKALPQMIKPDTSDALKLAILSHAKETARHVILLEKIIKWFGQPTAGEGAEELGGSLLELVSTPLQDEQPEWEISSYGCLHEWANLLGNEEGADFLEQVIAEDDTAKRKEVKLAVHA